MNANNKRLIVFKRNNDHEKRCQLKDNLRNLITDRKVILKITEHFYPDMFNTTTLNTISMQEIKELEFDSSHIYC